MRAPHLSVAGLALVVAGLGCIPSFPPCDCTKNDSGEGSGAFPDFDELDRSEDCVIPLPSSDGETGSESAGETSGEAPECGYPSGPYGFQPGARFENLELFDCMGNAVQIAQYLPQQGLPDVQTHGVVFGVGAVWCDPCRMEGEEWAAHFVDEYQGEIQFIQALDEGAAGSAVIPAVCAGWSSTVVEDKLPILYTPDVGALRAKIEEMAAEPIPFTLVFDANANVIFRQTGGIVDGGILTVQIDQLLNDPYGN
jgi:hypothetical protein